MVLSAALGSHSVNFSFCYYGWHSISPLPDPISSAPVKYLYLFNPLLEDALFQMLHNILVTLLWTQSDMSVLFKGWFPDVNTVPRVQCDQGREEQNGVLPSQRGHYSSIPVT